MSIHRVLRHSKGIIPGLLVWLGLCQIPAFGQSAAASVAGDVLSWNESEYNRMRRLETPVERAQRRMSEIERLNFDPQQYQIRDMFRQGLERIPDEEEVDTAGMPLAGLGRIRVASDDLDFDEERNFIYGRTRTVVHYRDFILEADRMLIDIRLREAHASGNVILRKGTDETRAESLMFNFETQRGQATQVDGYFSGLHFRSPEDEDPEYPAFQKINPVMSRFAQATVTGCDFPRPHYYVKAREFIIFEQDRVFARNAVLYIADVPVMFMPAYTRSLRESAPWSFYFGYDSKLGGAGRVTYDIYYRDHVPDPKDPDETIRKDFQQTTLMYDFFTQRGHGVGVEHTYDFDYDRHRGRIELYRIDDRDRRVNATDASDDSDRYRTTWVHRTNITRELQVLLNADWLSDPDFHYDIYDFFNEDETRRVSERRARAALTLVKEQWLARITIDIRDRIGRDRISDFSEPSDNDRDFDADLDSRGRFSEDVDYSRRFEGIPRSRWGRVSQRLPQVTVASSWLQPFAAPLYYQMDLNLINNLDKGLNVLSERDDAYVRGFDLYQSVMHAWRVSDTNVWTNRVGFGAAYMTREDDTFGYPQSQRSTRERIEEYEASLDELARRDQDPTMTGRPEGPIFVDSETFLVGEKEMRLSDYSPGYVYGDYESKWTTQFTNALRGYARYFVRQSSSDSLGEWYREVGNEWVRSDLYDFRFDKHEVTGGLNYRLARPDLLLALNAGQNLRQSGDLTPGENINHVGLTGDYRTLEDVLGVSGGLGYATTQIRHPSDRFEYERQTVTAFTQMNLFPKQERYWAALRVAGNKHLNNDPAREDLRRQSDDRYYFDETRTHLKVTPIIGARLGEKWTGEFRITYDGKYEDFDYLRLVLSRDFHDAILGLSFQARKRWLNTSRGDDVSREREWDRYRIRASVSFKLPGEQRVLTRGGATTLMDDRQRAAGVQY